MWVKLSRKYDSILPTKTFELRVHIDREPTNPDGELPNLPQHPKQAPVLAHVFDTSFVEGNDKNASESAPPPIITYGHPENEGLATQEEVDAQYTITD